MADPLSPCVEALVLLDGLGADDRVLHVARDERSAEALAAFLRGALPERPVLHLPQWDCLPFDGASPTPEAMGRRMAVLHALAGAPPGCVVVAALPVLLQRLPPRDALRHFPVRQGDMLDTAALQEFARAAGYVSDDRVDEPGEISVRGGAIEIFAGGSGLPCRIELADGVVTALRCYDPVTQRSTGEIEALDIVPVTELPPAGDDGWERGAEHRLPRAWDGLTILPDHLPGARLTALAGTLADADRRLSRLAEARAEAEADGGYPLPADALYLGAAEWAALAARIETLTDRDWTPVPAFAATARPRARLAQFLGGDAAAGRRVVFVAGDRAQQARIARMVEQADGHAPERVSGWADGAGHGRAILVADLAQGAVCGAIAVITAQDLIGSQAGPSGGRQPQAMGGVPLTGLDLGDIVVHEDHGLARLDGLEPLDALRPGAEAIRLTFARGERLMVPTHDAGRIWRYGSAEAGVALDRLGGTSWPRRRAATAKALTGLADRLVDLTRARAAATAPRLVPPARDYERFVARFPFLPTPDQAEAVRAVLADMASGRPMDRLVIGDVGFGKTEIALRAAAAAALAGRQVAVCAPTTVLARQHFETFRRRFAPLGIAVGHLSRLVTGKPAAALRAGLADGTVRIAVGTHALLAREIRFADLGLLVVDEEQRFGAAHKERLRALGQGLHALSMSATPIAPCRARCWDCRI